MATVNKTKTIPRNIVPKAPPKQEISKFGKMYGVYKELIIEREDCWD